MKIKYFCLKNVSIQNLRLRCNKLQYLTNIPSPQSPISRLIEELNKKKIFTFLISAYSKNGFLAIQKEISMEIIKHMKNIVKGENTVDAVIKMSRFPFPPYTNDAALTLLGTFLGFLLILSFMITSLFTVRALTEEKETQVKVYF